MNYYEIVSAIARGEKIYNLPLRVTYYCRVSTDSDVQLNSLDNQLDYYETYIKKNKAWSFVDGYIEEGVTGTRADKRPSFMRMIRDAKLNKFDLIITKDVSRFARDLEDSIHYIRELKSSGVGVFFENQSLNTFDPNSELTLNILFNIAQEESKKISASVKFGYRKAISQGHVLGSSNITGYRKDNCKLVIIEEEAKMIRKLFELYATGEYGFHKLAKKLSDEGYLNKKGRIYDKDSLKRMIQNPKYKGFYRARTYEILDYRTKKRKKNTEEDQVIYKCTDGSVPAIVSEELWDKANEVLNARVKGYADNNYWSGGVKYPFSSKIYCKEHNTNFQRSHGSRRKNRPTWSCGLYLQYRLSSCSSPIIAEKDLYNIFMKIMDTIIPEKNHIIDNMLRIYESIDKSNKYDDELNEIDKQLKIVEDKKSLALDLVLSGELRKDELKVQFANFENRIKDLSKKKTKILEQISILNERDSNIEKITKSIQEEISGGSLEDFIRKFVDEIIVSKIDDDRYNIKLDIYLNLLGNELPKIKGERHIDGATSDDILYLENQTCDTIEIKRAIDNPNRFTYNVYLKNI
ncbi:resolvase N-terminal domain protein [Firmicutes bacterium CAG:884]|nr:resolvase N-terminal domain protein [Firmicutes bacterium CAG:884]